MPSKKLLSDLGEKGFLKEVLPKLKAAPAFINGFGHDASIIDFGFGSGNIVTKIDRAACPIAAKNGWADYRLWGRLAVTANCSDILAVGGAPKSFMLCLCLPPAWPAIDAEEIIFGAAEECAKRGVVFAGGDTKEGQDAQVIGAATGFVEKGVSWTRSSAEPGDPIFLAGRVGGFVAAYLWLMHNGASSGDKKTLEALKRVKFPSARWEEARFLRESGLVKSAVDLSDGLADGLRCLPTKGNGAEILFSSLPFDLLVESEAERVDLDVANFAFGVGDWGLLFSVDKKSHEQFLRQVESSDLMLAEIGVITNSGDLAMVRGEERFLIDGIVNEHFRKRMEDQGGYIEQFKQPFKAG